MLGIASAVASSASLSVGAPTCFLSHERRTLRFEPQTYRGRMASAYHNTSVEALASTMDEATKPRSRCSKNYSGGESEAKSALAEKSEVKRQLEQI